MASHENPSLIMVSEDTPPAVAFDAASWSDTVGSFSRDNKRVRNDCIKHELGITLRYPTYKHGLVQLAAESQ